MKQKENNENLEPSESLKKVFHSESPVSNAADKSSKMKIENWLLDLAVEVSGDLKVSGFHRARGRKHAQTGF